MNQPINRNNNFMGTFWQPPPAIYSNYRMPLSEFQDRNDGSIQYYVNNNHTNNNYIKYPNLYPKLVNNQIIDNTKGFYNEFNMMNTHLNGYDVLTNRIDTNKSNLVDLNRSINNEYLRMGNGVSQGVRIGNLIETGSLLESKIDNLSINKTDNDLCIKTKNEINSKLESSAKLGKKNTCNSDWKEWNSYSKLLPLAVVELDVQNECNYLSNLFNKFSNTVKGFISSYEFEKLMDFVNIIEFGYRGTIFGVMDRNQDDYITEVEFLTGMLIFRPFNSKEKNAVNFNKLRLQFIFFYYDSNRDGVLSIEELAKLIEHISIIKVTISNRNSTKKKTQISTEKSRKLAKQIIQNYLNRDFCSYDNFYHLVNNGIINGTINLLRCRNDIFLQKKDTPLKQINKDLLNSNDNLNSSQIPRINNFNVNTKNVYNTPLNGSTEQFSYINNEMPNNFNEKLGHVKLSPFSHNIHSISENKIPTTKSEIEQINSTPKNIRNNNISNTITRKNDQFTYSVSPNNAIFTPEPTSNYKSNYGSTSPYNVPSEGHTNINLSYYR